MTNNRIPGAAILAAESAVFDAMIEHGPDGHTDGHDKIARAALAAAAPYIRAQALEEAAAEVDEGVPAYGQGEYADWLRERANTYRSQA